MNHKKLKWMIERAEGFRFVEKMHDVECPDQMYIGEYQIVKNKVRWPLLLQRIIEGINKSDSLWKIIYDGSDWIAKNNHGEKEYFNSLIEGDDSAKQSAIDYIYNIEMGE